VNILFSITIRSLPKMLPETAVTINLTRSAPAAGNAGISTLEAALEATCIISMDVPGTGCGQAKRNGRDRLIDIDAATS
jgi:hypothetical protein